jgi:hypothetical protein
MIIRGYPFHPSEQDMISAAGIKDQELTIIVSMMLIELAVLRLSRFKRLALLDTQGLELLVRCIREFGGRDARDNLARSGGEFCSIPSPAFSASSASNGDPLTLWFLNSEYSAPLNCS